MCSVVMLCAQRKEFLINCFTDVVCRFDRFADAERIESVAGEVCKYGHLISLCAEIMIVHGSRRAVAVRRLFLCFAAEGAVDANLSLRIKEGNIIVLFRGRKRCSVRNCLLLQEVYPQAFGKNFVDVFL